MEYLREPVEWEDWEGSDGVFSYLGCEMLFVADIRQHTVVVHRNYGPDGRAWETCRMVVAGPYLNKQYIVPSEGWERTAFVAAASNIADAEVLDE